MMHVFWKVPFSLHILIAWSPWVRPPVWNLALMASGYVRDIGTCGAIGMEGLLLQNLSPAWPEVGPNTILLEVFVRFLLYGTSYQ